MDQRNDNRIRCCTVGASLLKYFWPFLVAMFPAGMVRSCVFSWCGSTIRQVYKETKKLRLDTMDFIIVCIGTNDLGMARKENVDVMVKHMRKLFKHILQAKENIRIFYIPIPPRNDYKLSEARRELIHTELRTFNRRMKRVLYNEFDMTRFTICDCVFKSLHTYSRRNRWGRKIRCSWYRWTAPHI